MAAPYRLEVFSVPDGFVGKLTFHRSAEEKVKKHAQDINTVVILDISGSMGKNVERIATEILPAILTKLGYQPEAPITIITFESNAKVYQTTVGDIANLGLHSMGVTRMAGVIEHLRDVVSKEKGPGSPLRLLSLSDGALDDQSATVTAASTFAQFLRDRPVNSQAIRYFTSYAQPDTRGLASVLQFTNIPGKDCGLVDISSNVAIEEAIEQIASLFDDDGFSYAPIYLTSTASQIKLSPWDEKVANQARLVEGENFFWFTGDPSELTIDGRPVEVEQCGGLSYSNEQLIRRHLEGLEARLKLLNVVYSAEAQSEMNTAKEYLERLVNAVETNDLKSKAGEEVSVPDPVENALLQNRIMLLKQKAQRLAKGTIGRLREMLNDTKVHQLNSAQQSAYLRSNISSSSTGRALARRALQAGGELGVADILRNEVEAMHSNLAALAGVDDTNHVRSFYSLATTLAGIKALCELYEDEEVFDALDAMEILQIANVVGIACQAPVGDYPDPMVWRIDKIFPGCYVSVSDLIMAYQQSGDSDFVKIPQTDENITSVVPYFEDDRVQSFLQRHAPNMLDFLCSVGMRKVLAVVPKTYAYTIANGIWRLVPEIDSNKFEVDINCFCRTVTSYGNFGSSKLSQQITSCIFDQPRVDGKLMSFHLANNGIIGCLGTMIRMAKENGLMTPLLPRILRSLYSHEAYLALRKFLKYKVEDKESKMSQLLGIDFEKYGTPVGELFDSSRERNPAFHDQYHLDEELFAKFCEPIAFIDYVSLLPELIQRVFAEDPVASMKSLPSMSEETICQALGLSYSLKQFKLFTILQAYVYDAQSNRWNEKEQRMTFVDLGELEQAKEFVTEHIRALYEKDFQSRLAEKNSQETAIVAADLVNRLTATEDLGEFKTLLDGGFSKGSKSHRIVAPSSVGCGDLADHLADLTRTVPMRLEKIYIFLTGVDYDGEAAWNRGCLLRINKSPFENAYRELNALTQWNELVEYCKKHPRHVYRAAPPNRHGHSNDKPSYWALGYETVKEYLSAVAPEEQQEYLAVHTSCCGLRKQ